jgi:hypothetical protein
MFGEIYEPLDQEGPKSINRHNPERSSLRNIIVKLSKFKNSELKK